MPGCRVDIDLGDDAKKVERVLDEMNGEKYRAAAIRAAIDASAVDEERMKSILRGIDVDPFEVEPMPAPVSRPGSLDAERPIPGFLAWFGRQATALRWGGPLSNWIADTMIGSLRYKDQLQMRYRKVIDAILSELTPEDDLLIQKFLEEGADVPDRVRIAAERLNRVSFDLKKRIVEAGGVDAPVLENYFPRAGYDLDDLADRQSLKYRSTIGEMIRSGKAATEEEAANMIEALVRSYDDPLQRRKAGTFERERMGVPGYTKSAREAYTISLLQGARALAELKFFGPDEKRIRGAINRLASKQGKNAEFAESLLEQVLGNARDVGVPGPFKPLHALSLWRLTFTPFLAAAEIGKVYVRSGARPFFAAVADVFKSPIESKRYADWIGATMDNQFFSEIAPSSSRIERALARGMDAQYPKNLAAYAIGKVGASIAKMQTLVDNYFTRNVATRAGYRLFDDLASKVRTAGKLDDFTTERLREFRLNPTVVERAVLSGDEGALVRYRNVMAKELADQAAFTVRPTDRPKLAQSAMGSLFYQFKHFGTQQADFMVRETLAWTSGTKAGRARAVRAIMLLAAANPIMAMGVGKLKEWITGTAPLSKEKYDELVDDPSFTKFVMWSAAANAFVGSVGLVSDLAALFATGNHFSMRGFARPAAFGNVEDIIAMGAALKASAFDDDPEALERASRTAAGFFGPVGTGTFDRATGNT